MKRKMTKPIAPDSIQKDVDSSRDSDHMQQRARKTTIAHHMKVHTLFIIIMKIIIFMLFGAIRTGCAAASYSNSHMQVVLIERFYTGKSLSRFGGAVSISGNSMVVGAVGEGNYNDDELTIL